jgi:PAS domain S-box-containing protein
MTLPFLLTLLVIPVAAYFVGVMWRRRSMPAALPLAGFAVLILVYLLVHLTLYVPGPVRSQFIATTGISLAFGPYFHLLALLSGFGGTFWFLFALQYTGRGERLMDALLAVFALFWTGIFLLSGVGWVLNIELGSVALFTQLLSLGLFTMVALLVMGKFLVLETIWERNAIPIAEPLLLTGGALAFSLTSLLAGLEEHPGVPPLVLLVSLVQFIGVVRYYPVFDVLPVARVAGRDLLIEEVDEGVLVVDQTRRVRDMNTAAATMFGTDQAAVLGRPLTEVLPVPVDIETVARRQDPLQMQTTDGQILSLTADRVTDERGRRFGHVVRLFDITERRRREQRLGVLQQLLTGAIEEQLATVATTAATTAQRIEDGTTEPATASEVGVEIQSTVEPLKRLVAQTREIEEGLATPQTNAVALGELVEDCASTDNDRVTVSVTGEPRAQTDPDVVSAVVELLVEGTVVEGTVDLSVSADEQGAEIRLQVPTVGDEPYPTGNADALQHTADAGLPGASDHRAMRIEIARLAIESIDGTLSVETDGTHQYLGIQLPTERRVRTPETATTDAGGENQ